MTGIFFNQEFFKFLLAGGIAAAANLLSRMVFGLFLNYPTSIVLAFLVGLSTGYLLFRLFVFAKGENSIYQQLSYFIIINALALVFTLITSLFFYYAIFSSMKDIFLGETTAHFIGIAATTVTSYVGHKYLTFK